MAAKIGMQRCAASSQWLNDRISLSRYAHVIIVSFHTSNVFLLVCAVNDGTICQIYEAGAIGQFRS